MSAGYGYFTIDVVKKDGSPDEEKAKAVFDYCMNTFDWCTEIKPFSLEGHEIVTNYDDWPDGVEIKHTDVPTEDFEWLCEAQEETGADRIVAEIVTDFSESSYEENTNKKALIEDGEVKEETYCNYNSLVMGEVDSGSRYPALGDNCNTYKAKFKNKKTGQEVLGGVVFIYPNEDYDDVFEACNNEEYHYVFSNNDKAKLLDVDDEPTNMENFDHFSDDYDIMKDFDFPNDSPEDWEFVGFATQPSLFDRFASNPPIEELEEIW